MTKMENYDLSRSEWENLIDEWIVGRNAERNRQILKRRLLDGITYERLAEEFDMSTQNMEMFRDDGVHPTDETFAKMFERFKIDVPELFVTE